MQAPARALKYSIGLGFLAAALHVGLYLLPWWTLSPRTSADTIHPRGFCQPVGDDWRCESAMAFPNQMDAGALVWAEMPSSYYLSRFPLTQPPAWSAYTGSGYPHFLDGHSRWSGWSRVIWSIFPQDKTADWVTFLRIWLWAAGIGFACFVAGVSRRLSFVATMVAPILPYPRMILDHVFLDVDLLAPWVIALALLPGWKERWGWLAAISALVGWFVGLQVFVESQLVLAFAAAVVFLAMAVVEWRWSYFVGVVAMGVGFSISFVPGVLPYVQYFGELVSSRVPGSCFAGSGLGVGEILRNSVEGWPRHPEWLMAFSFPAVLFLSYGRERSVRGLAVAYLVFVATMAWGWPSFICGVKGVSGIGVVRHLAAATQAVFLVLVLFGATFALERLKTRPWLSGRPRAFAAVATVLVVAILYPTLKRGLLNAKVLEGKAQAAHAWNWREPGERSVFKAVAEKSRAEDRRHFSGDLFLSPNWGSAVGILEMRVLEALYPRLQHKLYATVVSSWQHGSSQPHIPDRFLKLTEPTSQPVSGSELEKLLVITRTSLLTMDKAKSLPPKGEFYSVESCRLLGEDAAAKAWLCPKIGGVGFFPTKLSVVESDEALETLLKKEPASFWIARAVVVKRPVAEAAGEVVSFERKGDELRYRLKVSKPGLFVVADTDFPGWRASVQGRVAEIVPVNIAWKGVEVPAGEVEVFMEFRPPVSFGDSVRAFFDKKK